MVLHRLNFFMLVKRETDVEKAVKWKV